MTDLRKMTLFRDVQVALDFQEMAQQGYLDTEFTMYGLSWWENGARHYMVSAKEQEIETFEENCIKKGVYASPIHSLRKVCHVPLGEKENIATTVKIDLAQMMQEKYPEEFWKAFHALAQRDNTDSAYEAIYGYCKNSECRFSFERLKLAESLIHLGYEHRVLKESSYKFLLEWLKEELKCMQDDAVAKDILNKQFFTVGYLKNGNYRYLTNARKESVYEKKIKFEMDGVVVSPIYEATYWYNYKTSVDQVKELHEKKCRELLNQEYFDVLTAIYSAKGLFELSEFEALESQIGDAVGKEMIEHYKRKWNVK